MKIAIHTRHRGFLLLEALIALFIFSISITGIVVALHRTTDLTQTIEREKWVQKQLNYVLIETLKSPQTKKEFEEGKNITLDEFGAQGIAEISESKLKNAEGLTLKDLYEVTITIIWYDQNKKQSASLKTLHYYPLYQH